MSLSLINVEVASDGLSDLCSIVTVCPRRQPS